MIWALYVTYTRADLYDAPTRRDATEELYRRQDEVGEKRGAWGGPCPAGAMTFEEGMAARVEAQRKWIA